jgi:multidrug efflux pump subunit AcrA (membrane-fusion protein)
MSTERIDVAPLFPAAIVGARRRKWPQRTALAVVVVAVAVLIGGLVMRASGSSPAYRTVAATQRDIQAMLQGVGTIEPVTQAAVAFPVSGTVAAVNVAVGDTVAAGQALASLDVSSLTATLHQQQAALDQAELTLQKALNGQSVTAPATTQSARTGTGPVTATLLAAVTSAVDPDVAAAEHAVLAAQKAVDGARDKAAAALSSAKSVCGAIGNDASDPSAATAAVGACQTALQAVMDAQASVSSAQSTLAQASKTLDDLLQKIANTPPPTTPPTTPPATPPPTTAPAGPQNPVVTSPPTSAAAPPAEPPAADTPTTAPPTASSTPPSASRGATGRTGGGSGGSLNASARSGSASSAKAPSAADLAAYQSAVDAATAGVTVAQQALDQATIVSPVVGTVVAVNMTPGQSATAASTTQTILVQGAGGMEATTNVSLADVTKVKVGQPASVTLDGAATPITGSVVSVAALPNSASTSTTTYTVTVSLPPDAASLSIGAIGSVGIVTGTASGTAVPSSAIRSAAGRHTVTVLEGTKTRQVPVQVGVVGDQWTQVTSGLQTGQLVVLATISDPLPNSATATTTANNRNRAGFVSGGGAVPGRGATP